MYNDCDIVYQLNSVTSICTLVMIILSCGCIYAQSTAAASSMAAIVEARDMYAAAMEEVSIKPNTHRRRRRDETVESRRVGVGGVYMNSRLAHDDCRRIRRCERTTQPSAVTEFTILQPMA